MSLFLADKPRCNCGVVAIYGNDSASAQAYLGLHALQHRGQESCGIVSSDGNTLYKHLGVGLVADVFRDSNTLNGLKGYLAIGHNRYSTTGSTRLLNAQPLVVNSKNGPFAVAHNGNFVNTRRLRAELEGEGSIFQR